MTNVCRIRVVLSDIKHRTQQVIVSDMFSTGEIVYLVSVRGGARGTA